MNTINLTEVEIRKAVLAALERKDPTIAFSLKSNLTRRLFKDTLDTATDPVTGIVNMQKYTDNILKYNSTLEALWVSNYSKMVSTLEQVRKYSPRLNENQVRSLVNEIKATKNVGQGTTFNRFLNSLEDKAKASGESIDLEKSALMRNIEIQHQNYSTKLYLDLTAQEKLIKREMFCLKRLLIM